MTDRELELIDSSKSEDMETAIEAITALCHEFFFPRNEFEKAEYLIFEKIGFQSSYFGHILEFTLAETYLKMGEITRARRFNGIALKSSVPSVREKAQVLQEQIEALPS